MQCSEVVFTCLWMVQKFYENSHHFFDKHASICSIDLVYHVITRTVTSHVWNDRLGDDLVQ